VAKSVISNTAKWKEFFTRYYKAEVQQLAISDQRDKALYITYSDLNRYDVRLTPELIENPDLVLAHAEEALTMVDLPVKKDLDARIRIVRNPKHLGIRDLEPRHVNTYVSVEATVQNITQPKPRIVEAAFECARCKNIIIIPQEGGGKFIEPTYCQCNEEKKGVFRLLYKESRFENFQRIRVQDSPEDMASAGKPSELDGVVTQDLVDTAWPGDRVTINGVLRSAQNIRRDGKMSDFDYYLDVNSIEKEQIDFEDYEISQDDEAQIRRWAAEKDSAEKFASCIAPWIHGRGLIKQAVTAQLFGGVRREIAPGKYKRGSIHVLLVGDPGGGKSDILEDAAKIAPRGWYGSGAGMSGVGLTAAVVPDDFAGDRYVLRAGVMPLYRYACIDEIGRIDSKEIEKLHTAMEQQIIPIAKAGINAKIRAQCSILAAGNPKNGRWDEYDDIAEQIGLDPALMNRFALVILTRDRAEEKSDRQIARQSLAEREEYETPYPREMLSKWIVLAQRTCQPELPEAVKQRLEDYYVDLRLGRVGDELKIIHPTPRQLEDARRLAEAFAKLRFSKVVEEVDVERAIKLLTESIRDASKGDADMVNVGTDTSQAGRYKKILDVVGELQMDQKGPGVPVALVLDELQGLGLERKRCEKDIRHMVSDRVLWHPETDKTKVAISKS
jgi:replicative DNA helicase Mcm